MIVDRLRSRGGQFDFLLISSSLVAVLLLQEEAEVWSLQVSSQVAVAAAVLSLGVVARRTERRLWSPSALFLLVMILFHVGLLVFLAVGVDPYLPNLADTLWLYGANASRAAYLVAVSLLTFGVATCVGTSNKQDTAYHADVGLEMALAKAGSVLLWLGCPAWFFLSANSGGAGVFSGSYSTFLSATSTLPLTYVYLAIGLGLSLLMLRPETPFSKSALGPFIVFAAVALPLGLRGEVLFPVAGAAAVLAYRRSLPRALPVMLIALVLLSGVSVIKQVRQVGVAQARGSVESVSPSRGLSELGYTFRVLVESVGWHERGHEPYLHYATYWAPVDRQVVGPALARERVDVRADPRVMNVEVRARLGAVGGSVLAEAHHNDGLRGILIVSSLLGLGLARACTGQVTTLRLALFAIAFVPLLNHIRNSFVAVPASCLLGLILVSSVVAFQRIAERRPEPVVAHALARRTERSR